MQLISTRQYNQTSSEYYKIPPPIERDESLTEMRPSQNIPFYMPIEYFVSQSVKELSLSLRPEKDIELLEIFYILNNPIQVKRFLLNHEDLINHLFETYEEIIRVFGENVVGVYLEYDRDPEEDFECLFIIVETNLSPETSLDLLESFDDEYWLDIDNETSNILEVMVRPL